MYTIEELKDRLPQAGTVNWIGVRTEIRGKIEEVAQVEAIEDKGLKGDHFSGRPGSKRQVTLIQWEHLQVVGNIMKTGPITPVLTRRNLVVKGINLRALKNRKFQIGEAVLEGTGECAPCSRMEENLGEGGWNAMRGHGGITAKVVKSGLIKLGDGVFLESSKNKPGALPPVYGTN